MACPICQQPNDEDFRFCQRCGYQRHFSIPAARTRPKLRFPLCEQDITGRLNELKQTQSHSRYAKQKSALEVELNTFLSSLGTPKALSTALPADIIAFLVWKDQGGRTVIHTPSCKFAGNSKYSCGECPKRLAYGTIDSLIGKLRAIFAETGRGTEWHTLLGVGNPAADRSVTDYLKAVREEQLRAHVTPRQAEPIVVSDLEQLVRYIKTELSRSLQDPVSLYLLARDQALFRMLFFSADRAADLLQVVTANILRFPDNSGLLLRHVWTKSLRSGDSNVFALKRGTNLFVCPVTGLELYLSICRAIGVKVFSGFLFRSVSKQGRITANALEPAAAQARLNVYVKALQPSLSSSSLTLHSFRSGAAISLALLDVPLDQIKDHVGWKSTTTALHYIKLK